MTISYLAQASAPRAVSPRTRLSTPVHPDRYQTIQTALPGHHMVITIQTTVAFRGGGGRGEENSLKLP